MNQQSAQRCEFASDNTSGMCPEALEMLVLANDGTVPSYGDDHWTRAAADKIREVFETDCEVFFVFNGTAANSLALSSMCRSYHSIICHELAHIETDECGGPEFFSNGTKLLTVGGDNGKVNLAAVESRIMRRHDIHYPLPRALSVTQTTEAGTVYSVAELQALKGLLTRHGLHLHMDGARFANAVAALNATPAELSWKSGVDVLCFGGTKNGMAIGEAVVFFNHDLARDFDRHCKQAGQLASKMRFIAAPWVRMLESGVWLDNARHANRCASRLARGLFDVGRCEIVYPCQANAVFVRMPAGLEDKLRSRGWVFHNFIGTGYSRFMCSWATREQDIDALVKDVAGCLST